MSDMVLKSYPPDRRLCVYLVLCEYISRTARIRKKCDSLFISYTVDTTIFKAHSVRAASVSKAKGNFVPVDDILTKGINLSGGQKQRVSLARAVYQNADVYLLDDPLSAVDANVGKHIFEKVVGPNGILNHKTRILVTHGLTCLPQVDVIIVLKEGEIVEVGSFEELIGHAGSFAEYMKTYLSEKLQNDKIGTLKDDKLSEDMVSIFGSVLNEEERTLLERQLSESVDKSVHTGEVLTVPEFKNSNSDDSQCLPELEDIQKTSYIVGHETDKLVEKITQPEQGLKLILDEKVEHGMVKFAVFWTYLKSVGVVLSMMTVILFVFFNGISIYSHIWLSEWSSDLPIYRNGTNGTIFKEVDIPQRNMRLLVYGALGLLQGIFTIFASLALYVGNIYAGRALHDHLVNNILASPMMFFDTTPTGRILNRFSKDVDVLDTQIGRIYESWLSCLLRVISVPIVIGYSTPYFLIAFLPLAIIYIAVQRFYVATSRQLKRLESTLRSPIYSHFGESINGVATIRAFGQQNVFIQSSENKVDENNRCYYPSIVANRWLAVRLEFVGNSVVFFACLFAVFGRATLTGGTVGLSVTYALNVTQTLNWLVRMTTELETNIIAVERVKEYSEIPREAPLIIAETTPEKTWPQKGEIVFSNYCVRLVLLEELELENLHYCLDYSE
uniref:ABC-type glutathione-S-conjugate transporter n=1 Tax=Magallana gigas TaxID=29159 RepID=A0A8W8INE2_MAGGI